MSKLEFNDPVTILTGKVIGAAIEVHKYLGSGLLESAYETCMAYELNALGLRVERQKPFPVIYKDIYLDHGYRINLLVEDTVIVELKTVEEITDVHKAQILSYLKFSGCNTGLLINFNVALLKNGIQRFKL